MKQRLTKRVAVIVGASVLALSGGAYAVAQGDADDREKEREAFLGDAAQRLDTTPEKLDEALKQAALARVDAAVRAGRLTEEQGEEIKQRIEERGVPLLGGPHGGPGFHHRGGPPPGMEAAAEYLGLEPEKLREQLMDGKSLADVAEDRDKSVDGLKRAMEKAIRADVEKAVDDGRLTRRQADRILEGLASRIDEKVERSGGPRGPHGRGGPGFGPPPGGPPPDAPPAPHEGRELPGSDESQPG
jgi:hypothetical protein